jgi:hypothetical protein
MGNRREFIKSVAALGVAGVIGAPATSTLAQTAPATDAETKDRNYWLGALNRISSPVLESLSHRELRKKMPVEAANPHDRAQYTHLEAFGRLLAGIAPWLAADGLDEAERSRQQTFLDLARGSLDAATDPNSPDFMNFDKGGQPLVDIAFLAEGILRAPDGLWNPLKPRVQKQVIQALKASRKIGTPTDSNWTMFAAMVETALLTMGQPTIEDRLENCLRHMLSWYEGDGLYGDGKFFHFDYYNSFVIHPMLVDVLAVLRQKDGRFEPVYQTVLHRSRRYAEILERLIAPDGTFPSVGRSTTYRFGALQELAQIALLRELPERVKPPQVRTAMTAVIRKMIEAPGTFDREGWLQIGFYGHQPALAEWYISTGSLYLCTAAFLPLGLPPADEFWSGPATQWTQQKIWSGQNLPPDHAIHDVMRVEVPTLNRHR